MCQLDTVQIVLTTLSDSNTELIAPVSSPNHSCLLKTGGPVMDGES